MTLLERQIRTLKRAGIEDVVIVTGYRGEMLALPGTRQVRNERWDSTNMIESLFAAEPEFGDDLVVSYSDISFEPEILDTLLQSQHDISVVVDLDWKPYWECRFEDPLSDAESLRLDNNRLITEIGNPVSEISEIEAQYIGLLRFRGGGVDALKKARAGLGLTGRPWMQARTVDNAYMTDLLMELILTGVPVHGVPVNGGWLEIDTPRDLDVARRMIRNGAIDRTLPAVPGTSTI